MLFLSCYHFKKFINIRIVLHPLFNDMQFNILNLQVYHAKFLEICRGKKVVQESFRLVKLIENPMLSTFNILLVVCINTKDVEGNSKKKIVH